MTTKSVPAAACRFRTGVRLDMPPAGTGGATAKDRTFSMLANTGKVLAHGFWGNLGIDLDGVKFKGSLPALLDHDPAQRVGFTTKVERTEAGLVASGKMLTNEHAQTILQDSDEGFPWQASVMLEPVRIEEIPAGQTATVNGQAIAGPGHVLRESVLREVTFCTLGADDDTSAATLASDGALTFSADISTPDRSAGNAGLQVALAAAQRSQDTQAALAAVAAANAQRVRDAIAEERAQFEAGERGDRLYTAWKRSGCRMASAPQPEVVDVQAERAQFEAGPRGDRVYATWKKNQHRTRRCSHGVEIHHGHRRRD